MQTKHLPVHKFIPVFYGYLYIYIYIVITPLHFQQVHPGKKYTHTILLHTAFMQDLHRASYQGYAPFQICPNIAVSQKKICLGQFFHLRPQSFLEFLEFFKV